MKTRFLLRNLLTTIFDEAELRGFLQDYGTDLSGHLPGSSSSLVAVAEAAIAILERRGLLDSVFFERLLIERPRYTRVIEQVREQWMRAVPLTSGMGRGKFQARKLVVSVLVLFLITMFCLYKAWLFRGIVHQSIATGAREQCAELSQGGETVKVRYSVTEAGGTPWDSKSIEHSGNLMLGECVAGVVSDWAFPASLGGSEESEVSIRFP